MKAFVLGFVLGSIAILAFEAALLLYLLKLLRRKSSKSSCINSDAIPNQSLDFAFNSKKKGVVWVLEDKIPNPKEQLKKNILEVHPVRKNAEIKDGILLLRSSNSNSDSPTSIPLKGCTIQAVSGSSLSSKKWAKRFPIKVENETACIYQSSRAIYIYLDTCWEKESWCKALRLASCHDDPNKLQRFAKLAQDFRTYLTCLNTGNPSFMKPTPGLVADPTDKVGKLDAACPSKVRHFLRKLSRKTSKSYLESKPPMFTRGSVKLGTSKVVEENEEPGISRTSSLSQFSVMSDTDCEDKLAVDDGTLCLNLLMSRLFFDARKNAGIKNSIQVRIQKTLSNMRIPSYMGEVVCINLDIGHLPPYVHALRVLPADMNEVWAFDVDIEYSGGAVLDVETRIEVGELDAQKGLIDGNTASSAVGDVSSDLLDEFEEFGKQLNVSEGTTGGQDKKDDRDPKLDSSKNQKAPPASTSGSRWKSILNSIAKQVSQVPISLSLRVTSLRGTVRLHIKPPPSDQLWFSFTSMPDIDFELESSVGDHKITSAQIAQFMIGRFKAAIRENLVLPNCESVCIPWMIAEKDDWVPVHVAPFMWRSQEATGDNPTTCESFSNQPGASKTGVDATGTSSMLQERPTDQSVPQSKSLQELNVPLLASDELEESNESKMKNELECPSSSRSTTQSEKQNYTSEEEDSRPKKLWKRERMLDFRKKMGEKLEEKRRHIEEKGRNIVERMRGP